jgi:tetratricopeptide (TPR) repeat protein
MITTTSDSGTARTKVRALEISNNAQNNTRNNKGVKVKIWETYAELADNAYRKGFYDIVAKMLLAVLKDLRTDFPESTDLPLLLLELGKYYHQQQQFKKAEIMLKRSMESFQRERRNYEANVCLVLAMLAEIHSYYGRYQLAERLYKRQFSVTARLYGKHSLKLVISLKPLISLYQKYGKTERAEALVERMKIIEEHSKAS